VLNWSVVAVLTLGLLGAGQEKPPSEYEVKAAYLFNFAKFVEWPAQSFPTDSSPLVFGVLGKDPFGETLEQAFAGQKVGGRGFEIRRGARIQDLGPCHILFISDSESERLEAVLDSIRGMNALTVSDLDKFASSGGVIGFFHEEKRIRFEVNPDAAQRAGLKLSSKLLKLARIVKGK
jgi:hypothetical protein